MMLSIDNLMISRQTSPTTESSPFTISLPKLMLQAGNVIFLRGDSGSGKSTLLEMIGLILKPSQIDRFDLTIAGDTIDLAKLIKDDHINQLAAIRSQHLGFMLQTGGLLPFLSIKDNLVLPLKLLQQPVDESRLHYLVDKLKLQHLLTKYPNQLSIGERQRASFIRSIIHKPALLLADEPTSALDPYNAKQLFELIVEQAKQDNIASIIVTHDQSLLQHHNFTCLSAHIDDQYSVSFLSQQQEALC